MSYEEILWHAIEKCEDWFVKNPAHLKDKAKLIIERRIAYVNKSNQVNTLSQEPISREISEPSLVNPITVCIGTFTQDEKVTEVRIPSDKNDVSMVYYAALLILHDYVAYKDKGYRPITENIWPKDLVLWAGGFLNPRYTTNDRSDFVEAALRHVEAELKEAPTPLEIKSINGTIKPSIRQSSKADW
jgi:hypothetical protein